MYEYRVNLILETYPQGFEFDSYSYVLGPTKY